jgi:hypothetical protein
MKPAIIGITVSCDFADKSYGSGEGSFCNCQARYPEAGLPPEQISQAVDDGLDLYFAAWQTLMSGRYAVGVVDAKEYKEHMESATRRLGKVREYLKTI